MYRFSLLTERGKGGIIMADNRIAYGLAKKYGIDTKGMSPKEVWDALKEKGISQDNAEEKYSESNATPAEKKRLQELGFDTRKENDDKLTAEERRLKELGINNDREKLSATDNVTFHSKMEKAKASLSEENRWRVDIHDVEDYKNDKLFVSKGGSCVAVEPNGNIISVCKKQGDNINGKDLIKYAIENGGDRLDAFGDGLYKFYTKQGFEPVSWTPFNEEYAPEGWNKNRDEPEPVIFYKYTGKVTKEPYNEFINRVAPSNDYDTAMEVRDKELKNNDA